MQRRASCILIDVCLPPKHANARSRHPHFRLTRSRQRGRRHNVSSLTLTEILELSNTRTSGLCLGHLPRSCMIIVLSVNVDEQDAREQDLKGLKSVCAGNIFCHSRHRVITRRDDTTRHLSPAMFQTTPWRTSKHH
jgi:hypothetical protein